MDSTLIIAEAGVNHNGQVELAYQLVDAAVAAGVDIIKFQTFKAENLVTPQAQQADYQRKNSNQVESQYHMLKKLELSFSQHLLVRDYCQQQGIAYLSTAFDADSLQFLITDINLPMLKIPSGELTNAPLLLAHAYTGRELIMSTGMATLAEIELALGIIAFGLLHKAANEVTPNLAAFKAAYNAPEGKKLLAEKVSLLHCTTEYPAPINEVNLNAMELMRETFGLPVGYSDHTEGILVPTMAVAKGAVIIEKHFTLDRNLPGPDHQASLEPSELKQMVQNIRQLELALGDKRKSPTNSEQKNITVARKSLVAKQAITKGQPYSEDNLTVLRPGSGISAVNYFDILHTKANKDYQPGDLITP
ncbi:N-acetylneuraminate synthase [Colwellia chukchiensis]|uniref:N-acetylneuraminate synthase n=1 Tax=Colwellia chukchiensis TaxID=641665 RepID=A0A1H7HGW8_9GAMM|nr:N-acetylneuraminate synthase [Colwellia chukchiensis]SEK49524.1 N-acetylneuraminate synthase [Colwellia chukchiensis]